MNIKKILNAVTQVCVLSLISISVYADVALRVVCSGADQGAIVYINDTKKGACPNDFFVESGDIQFRAVKVVDADNEQTYEENFFIEDGGVKKIKVSLSTPQLTAAAIKRMHMAKLNQEKQLAETTLEQARKGDVDAMNSLVVLYEQGRGLIQNTEKSNYWRAKAKNVQLNNHAMAVLAQAEQGQLHAIDEMIDIYAAGKGLEVDAEKAQQWRDKKDAILKAKDERIAQDMLQKAQAGDLSAMQTVAGLYKSGKGFEQSSSKAQEWEDNYLNALNQQKMLEKKEFEIQNKREEIKSIDYFMGFHAMQDIMKESDGILAVFTITLLPTMVLTTVSDLLSAPYKTTKQIMLQNEIDAHAAQWGAPNSMVSKASH